MTARTGALVEAVAARNADRLPDRRDAGRRSRDPDLPLLFTPRETLTKTPGGVRPRRDRRRRGTGGGQQCLGRRDAGAASDARAADLGDGGDHARGLPAVRTAAGPAALRQQPELVWGLIASLFIANIMLLVLNLPLVGLWVRLLSIPQPWLYARHPDLCDARHHRRRTRRWSNWHAPGRSACSAIGLRRYDYPIAPVVVGLILGPLAEQQLRRALAISQGDPLVLVQSPMSATLLGISALALIAPFVMRGLRRFKADED